MPEELGKSKLMSLDECCALCKQLDDQWEMGPDNVPVLVCPDCIVQKTRQAQAHEKGRDAACSTEQRQN